MKTFTFSHRSLLFNWLLLAFFLSAVLSACAPVPPLPEGIFSELSLQDASTPEESSKEEVFSEPDSTENRDASKEEDCVDGLEVSCHLAPAPNQNVGICVAGKRTCLDGKWGRCVGAGIPSKEICNGKDDDCDGDIDESFPTKGELCDTGESGPCRDGKSSCIDGEVVCVQTTMPKKEVCNRKDDDCNGKIDDSFPEKGKDCRLQSSTPCDDGHFVCDPEKLLICKPKALSKEEVCNGVDDNCDGKIDDVFPEQGKSCARKDLVAPCKAGTYQCQGGVLLCISTVQPTVEECNGKDDDCDGEVDEKNAGGGGGCRVSGKAGDCARGLFLCRSGVLVCMPRNHDVKEICNGVDDNCDGKVDDVFPGKGQSCIRSEFLGLCNAGAFQCQKGRLVCQPHVQPTTEVCNNKDDDCDGVVDENLQRVCYWGPSHAEGIGVCRRGKQVCQAGVWSRCAGDVAPIAERCNGLDDDCDGSTDEDFPQLQKSCTAGKGECVAPGIEVCKADGSGTECRGAVGTPKAEVCNGKDDDCDGTVDEGLVKKCYTGVSGCVLDGSNYKCVGTCQSGTQTCSAGQWSACSKEVQPTKEICNGKDDDCDGAIDDNIPTGLTTCAVHGGTGPCAAGLYRCQYGRSVCRPFNYDAKEVCNGKDDNCNGQVDENNPGGGGHCKGPGPVGYCSDGKLTCQGGQLTCVLISQNAVEYCNGKDDDCDGTVDESCICKSMKMEWIRPTPTGHKTSLLSVRYDTSGSKFATLDKDSWLRVWDATTKKFIKSSRECAEANSLAFVNGKTIVNCLRTYEPKVHNQYYSKVNRDGVGFVVYWELFPDGYGSFLEGPLIRLTKPSRKLFGVDTTTRLLHIREDGRYVIHHAYYGIGSNYFIHDMNASSGITQIFNTTMGNLQYPQVVKNIRLARDNKSIFFSTTKGVEIWDYNKVKQRTLNWNCTISETLMTKDLKLIVGQGCKSIVIWNAATGTLVRTLSRPNVTPTTFDLSPGGKKILVGYSDGSITEWSTSGTLLYTIQPSTTSPTPLPHTTVSKLIFSPDSKYLLSMGAKRTLIWDVASGNLLSTHSFVGRVSFHPTKPRFAVHTGKSIVSYDISAKTTKTLVGISCSSTTWLEYDKSGQYVYYRGACPTGSTSTSILGWDPDTSKVITHLKSLPIGKIYWASDLVYSTKLVGGYSVKEAFRISTGVSLGKRYLVHQSNIWYPSPDGTYIKYKYIKTTSPIQSDLYVCDWTPLQQKGSCVSYDLSVYPYYGPPPYSYRGNFYSSTSDNSAFMVYFGNAIVGGTSSESGLYTTTERKLGNYPTGQVFKFPLRNGFSACAMGDRNGVVALGDTHGHIQLWTCKQP